MSEQTNGAPPQVTRDQFLGKSITKGYRPSVMGRSMNLDHRPFFTPLDVEMMRRDPQVRFGLRLLFSPLPTVKRQFQGDPEVVAYAEKTHERVWTRHLSALFKCVTYGWCGGEVYWKDDRDTNLIQFDRLGDVHPMDLRPLELDGQVCGVSVKASQTDGDRPWLLSPRSLWIAYEPEFGSHWGNSRLKGAWVPFMEKTPRHGALDVRRLWFLKNAYRGGMMRHPGGSIEVAAGEFMTCADYARQIVETFETGGVLTLPNDMDEQGNYLWVWEPPETHGEPVGVSEYVKDLDNEILTGLEIPLEVARAQESGSGWAGRSVPFLVFLTSEDQIADTIFTAVDHQIVRPGIAVNYGLSALRSYSAKLLSLVPKEVADQATRQGEAQGGQPAPPTTGKPPEALPTRLGFDETKHPRADDGRFGDKAGGGAGKADAAPAKPAASAVEVRHDKRGYRMCFSGGKRTKCPPLAKSKPQGALPATKRGNAKDAPALMASARATIAKGVTVADLGDLAESMMSLRVEDIKALAADMGAKVKSRRKADMAREVATAAMAGKEIRSDPAEALPPVPTSKAGVPELRLPEGTTLDEVDADGAIEAMRTILGAPVDRALLAAATNAQDGMKVSISIDGAEHGGVMTSVMDRGLSAFREIYRDENGDLVCHNNSFFIQQVSGGPPDYARVDSPFKGQGAAIFANQVQALRKLGVKRITTSAGKSQDMNGYYTWPRLGYSAEMRPEVFERLPPALKQQMGDSRDVLDLMGSKEGQAWWKENGTAVPATFDLADGSKNMKALAAYLAERNARGGLR